MKGKGNVTLRTRRIGMAVLCCSIVFAPEIWAFFPIGTFDTGVLLIRKYRINDFDQNNDGQITEGEGIPVLLEGGRSGFTDAELDIVRQAFGVWQQVPQSYASFHEEGIFTDPVVADGASDFRNTIVMQVTEVDLNGDGLPDENVVPDQTLQPLDGSMLGIQVDTFLLEDTVIDFGGESYLVSAGSIIDNDIVINASAHRPATLGERPTADLLGTMVHLLGRFLGLDYTLLNNLNAETDPADPSGDPRLRESTALVHSVGGVKQRIGVTPTMFPLYFEVFADNGDLRDGASDLAPDDISGISWLYPRGSQDLFFNLSEEARTRTRPGTGLPSIAIPGAHIVAWADVDNDPTTPRVAVFSTLSGLYEHPENVLQNGEFDLLGMWKTMETESGLFNATYTYTMNPLNGTGYSRQAPPGVSATDFGDLASQIGEVFTAFPSEVFHEVENIIDIANKDAGTPVVWDYQRRTPVSTETERAVAAIVGDDPMFGDPNDVCILNVVGAAKAGSGLTGLDAAVEGANSLRSVRDGVFLQSALGSFVVDTYYKLSPTGARFILSNATVFGLTIQAVDAVYWVIRHAIAIFLFLVLAIGAVFAGYRHRKSTAIAGAGLFVLTAFLAAPAEARILYQTTEQLVAGADEVVVGRVVSATSRQDSNTQHLYTDIVLEIEDMAKGTLQKQTELTFTQIGGRLNGIVTRASDLPTFKAGERVILYLRYVEGFGYTVYNGIGGKTQISYNPVTEEKTVKLPVDLRKKRSKELAPGEEVPVDVPLADYLEELRAIARAQEKANQ